MKDTRLIMGMPITVEIVDENATLNDINTVYDYFDYVDKKFSVYKESSEISLINKGEINKNKYSDDMKEIFEMSEIAKKETNGYFDIFHNGRRDPSGMVKGWAINNAAKILADKGFTNYYVEAGGDIQASGTNSVGAFWQVGIRNPFNIQQIVKVIELHDNAVATSGTYFRGQHIYNPKKIGEITEIVSLTVIGPNILEADKYATACFAMGSEGIKFIENLKGFEGYMINKEGIATYTTGFDKFVVKI